MKLARPKFYVGLALFAAWVIGLGIMAYTSGERPRNEAPLAMSPRP